jgi:ubiquitin-activating enzyme E1 C
LLQTTFPLCTLSETPRCAAHCIEWAHLIHWGSMRGDEAFDTDDPEHMKWVFDQASARAEQFSIPGVTLQHTQVAAPVPRAPPLGLLCACRVE